MASAWGSSWKLSWLNSWGPVGGADTHDGGASEYYYKWWKKQHEKKKAEPTLAEVIEAVQEHPEEALKAVPQAKKHFQEINYEGIRNNAIQAEFIAREILVRIEMKRLEDEENEAIEMLLLM